MVRTCDYPGCSNKDVSESPHTFHRFPVTDVAMRQLWLLALGFHVSTKLPKMKKLRVCSVHFSEDDYISSCQGQMKRRLLKSSAAPQLYDPEAVMDRAPDQANSTDIQENVPETCTSITEKPTLQHIVDEEAILQLMNNCPMCDRKCRCRKRISGPYFIVYQSCYFCSYQRKWANQPEAGNMNIHKANVPPKKKLQRNVSESHDPEET